MAMMVDPPNGIRSEGKHYYSMWRTLFEIDTKYVPIKPIGRGAYGIVCSSINRETNEKVAIKKINNVFDNRIDALRTLRELKLLRHLRHENVIALKDIMMPAQNKNFRDVYLVYELMDTDLHQIIKSPQPLSNDHLQYFLFQLLRGLKYLHSANILHRDLKPGNLLVNSNCDLKICDFGLARASSGKSQFMTEYVVTRWYRAPELLLCCEKYGTSIDVWSVGCIFAELLGRKPIFPGTECLNQLKLIINVLGTMNANDIGFIDNPKARRFIKSLSYTPGIPLSSLYPNANPLALDLLGKMLVFDPSKRISVAEALEHPYMSGLLDPNADPAPQVPNDLDIDEDIEEDVIRELMWEEMLHYHPQASYSTGTPSVSSSQETDLLPEMDQKKRKRMLSNRQSARRSRERKQKHVEDLIEQVSLLKKENGQILTILNLTRQNYVSFEAENSVLRTQMMELTSRLNSLNEIVQNMNFYGNTSEPHMMIPDNFINLWSFLCKNQPIMASSEMIQFY
ncbi:Mitogen-activated protein kinase 3 [Dendrobium catenatum]|uniref:Mitogen-activated protein kinase n=2 Tax=Dendrobium TaxID=37818 RepID=A0A2I0VEQ5_9ASPA|nr:Mitogen-activated protein kinase 3 [Dendrobium catenatum]